MKILVITWNYPPTVGGIEQVAFHLTQGLRSHGDEVTVVAAGLTSSASRRATNEPDVLRAKKPGMRAFFIHAVVAGWRQTLRQKPDVIICPSLTSAPAAWIVSRLARRPYCILIHGSDILISSRLYQLLIRRLMAGARLLFANSRHTARVIEETGIAPEKIMIVNPGVTPPPVSGETPSSLIAALLDSTKGRPIMLTVGRLVKRKGIIECIERVFPLLLKTFPDLVYLIVGDEPKASLIHHERILDQLKQAIDVGGHQDRVHLLGRLSDADLQAVYQHAHVFVLPCIDDPHDIEGFGIVILEAAWHGVPAVATHTGGIPDAIVHDETGKLVKPGDDIAMAKAIGEILANPELRATLGSRARARTAGSFTWHAIAARYRDGLAHAIE